jgi:hypothetical protein
MKASCQSQRSKPIIKAKHTSQSEDNGEAISAANHQSESYMPIIKTNDSNESRRSIIKVNH